MKKIIALSSITSLFLLSGCVSDLMYVLSDDDNYYDGYSNTVSYSNSDCNNNENYNDNDAYYDDEDEDYDDESSDCQGNVKPIKPSCNGNVVKPTNKPTNNNSGNSNYTLDVLQGDNEDSDQKNLGSTQNMDRNAVLAEHNKARREVGVPNLRWSTQLENIAYNYAQELASSCSFQHSNNGYGENLFYGTKGYYTAVDGVKAWWDEKKDYDYENNTGNGKVVGHYTQLVWRKTTEVGCGVAIGCGNLYLVCNYNPAGNFNGEWPY